MTKNSKLQNAWSCKGTSISNNKALKLDPNSAEVAFKLGYSLVRNEQKEMGLN